MPCSLQLMQPQLRRQHCWCNGLTARVGRSWAAEVLNSSDGGALLEERIAGLPGGNAEAASAKKRLLVKAQTASPANPENSRWAAHVA